MTLMRSRPHYDPDSAYFTTTFDLECQCLDAHRQLVRSIVDVAMETERGHSECLWEERSHTGKSTRCESPLERVLCTGFNGVVT